MKSLILKDIYNIAHNAKTMIAIWLVLAFCLIPSSGAGSFIVPSTLICSMMVVTTFSFDENSQWMKYAMIMPLSKEKLVASKFCVALIFSLTGALIGLVSVSSETCL